MMRLNAVGRRIGLLEITHEVAEMAIRSWISARVDRYTLLSASSPAMASSCSAIRAAQVGHRLIGKTLAEHHSGLMNQLITRINCNITAYKRTVHADMVSCQIQTPPAGVW